MLQFRMRPAFFAQPPETSALLTRPSLHVGHSLLHPSSYMIDKIGNYALYSLKQPSLYNLRPATRSMEYVGGRFNEMKRLILFIIRDIPTDSAIRASPHGCRSLIHVSYHGVSLHLS